MHEFVTVRNNNISDLHIVNDIFVIFIMYQHVFATGTDDRAKHNDEQLISDGNGNSDKYLEVNKAPFSLLTRCNSSFREVLMSMLML